MNPEIQVRDARPADLATVVDFNCRLAAETEAKTLDRAIVTPGVAAALADRNKGRYFVAEIAGQVVGQLMVTYEWSDWRNGNIWWLQSVYVLAEHRRAGVFKRLMEHLAAVQTADPEAIGLRLYVDDENRAAQATYLRLGFELGHYRVMERLMPR
jgi:ribosomal protein S18 acetylase RimI-like enzyme